MTDTITVVIPAYNAEEYVAEAIESVLAQEGAPVAEVIVVDDGSVDGTVAAVERFGDAVRIVRGAHRGAGAARNLGVGQARSALVAFLDADDLWTADSLGSRWRAFVDDPTLDVAFGHAEQFLCERLDDEERDRIRIVAHLGATKCAGTTLARRSVFERVAFPEHFETVEFIEWWTRARTLGLRVHTVDQVVLRRRAHSGHLGRSAEDAYRSYLRVARAEIERRRAT